MLILGSGEQVEGWVVLVAVLDIGVYEERRRGRLGRREEGGVGDEDVAWQFSRSHVRPSDRGCLATSLCG